MYTIFDTFNERTISSHRTLYGAVRAQARFARRVERANGRGHYIPTTILLDGQPLFADEHDEAVDIMMSR